MIKKARLTGWLVAGMLASSAAQASVGALYDRGGGMIYDSWLNITWLADANYAKTSGYEADGLMIWSAANAWAAGLTYGGYNDWRLPTADQNCLGYNCQSSELGHLFYAHLGATAGSSILTSPSIDLALFANIQSSVYWFGTEYANLAGTAWIFNSYSGGQGVGNQSSEFFAWAVRDGDVAAQAVSEPMSLALAGLGLAGLMVVRRRPVRSGTPMEMQHPVSDRRGRSIPRCPHI